MKKILVVNKYFYHIGGIEEVVRSIAGISDKDLNITVLACKSEQNFYTNKTYTAKIKIKKTITTIFSTPLSLSFATSLIFEYFRNDVIHLHSPYPFAEVIVSILSILKRKKIIITYHSDIIKQKLIFNILYVFLRFLFVKSDAICVTSPFLSGAKLLIGLENKIIILPIGIEDKFDSFNRDYNKGEYLLFVGRLVYYKGLKILVSAIKDIDLSLKIVGSGPLEFELRNEIENLGIKERVQILTNVSDHDLIDLYKNSICFILPSIEKTEAFGIVQLQAMSSGLPVINTELGTGVSWVARNMEEAITVKPNNIYEMKRAIMEFRNSFTLRAKLGSAGRLRFEKKFKIDSMLEKYVDLYKSS